MCSVEGLLVEPLKVEAVIDWVQPTSGAEVRSPLGLAGYHRCFVETHLYDGWTPYLIGEEGNDVHVKQMSAN